MARGVDGREVFVDDLDRRDFLGTILGLKSQTNCSIIAYCLMGNHFHLAIKVGTTPLSHIMHRLLTAYVIGFNARHAREGHLFQARYKSVLCLDDSYLIALVRYIHMNPVRAGLTVGPEDWPWSSHRYYAERTGSPLVDPRLFFDVAGSSSREYERSSANAAQNIDPGRRPDRFRPYSGRNCPSSSRSTPWLRIYSPASGRCSGPEAVYA